MVSIDSWRASSTKAQVLTTTTSAPSGLSAGTRPSASIVPTSLSESTWFLGQPNVSIQKLPAMAFHRRRGGPGLPLPPPIPRGTSPAALGTRHRAAGPDQVGPGPQPSSDEPTGENFDDALVPSRAGGCRCWMHDQEANPEGSEARRARSQRRRGPQPCPPRQHRAPGPGRELFAEGGRRPQLVWLLDGRTDRGHVRRPRGGARPRRRRGRDHHAHRSAHLDRRRRHPRPGHRRRALSVQEWRIVADEAPDLAVRLRALAERRLAA